MAEAKHSKTEEKSNADADPEEPARCSHEVLDCWNTKSRQYKAKGYQQLNCQECVNFNDELLFIRFALEAWYAIQWKIIFFIFDAYLIFL